MKKGTLLITAILLTSLSIFAQAKGDPWIKKVYNSIYSRDPNAFEYNIRLYNDGHWKDYMELLHFISDYNTNLIAAGISLKVSSQTYANNSVVVGVFQNGTLLAANLISNDGGGLVAAGGGNLIAAGAGNLIAAGAGNFTVTAATKGASFGGSYTLASAGTKVIKTSGSGAMIIK